MREGVLTPGIEFQLGEIGHWRTFNKRKQHQGIVALASTTINWLARSLSGMDTAVLSPLPDPTIFLEHLFTALHANGLKVEDMELDHLCYRVATVVRYSTCMDLFAQHGTLLAESLIAGRPIATYRLHQGFRFRERIIDMVELPSPKPGSTYHEGYEHSEFVVEEDLLVFTQRYPKLAWELDDLYKPTNADVRLRYPDFSVKFHRQSLAEVIDQELRDQR